MSYDSDSSDDFVEISAPSSASEMECDQLKINILQHEYSPFLLQFYSMQDFQLQIEKANNKYEIYYLFIKLHEKCSGKNIDVYDSSQPLITSFGAEIPVAKRFAKRDFDMLQSIFHKFTLKQQQECSSTFFLSEKSDEAKKKDVSKIEDELYFLDKTIKFWTEVKAEHSVDNNLFSKESTFNIMTNQIKLMGGTLQSVAPHRKKQLYISTLSWLNQLLIKYPTKDELLIKHIYLYFNKECMLAANERFKKIVLAHELSDFDFDNFFPKPLSSGTSDIELQDVSSFSSSAVSTQYNEKNYKLNINVTYSNTISIEIIYYYTSIATINRTSPSHEISLSMAYDLTEENSLVYIKDPVFTINSKPEYAIQREQFKARFEEFKNNYFASSFRSKARMSPR